MDPITVYWTTILLEGNKRYDLIYNTGPEGRCISDIVEKEIPGEAGYAGVCLYNQGTNSAKLCLAPVPEPVEGVGGGKDPMFDP